MKLKKVLSYKGYKPRKKILKSRFSELNMELDLLYSAKILVGIRVRVQSMIGVRGPFRTVLPINTRMYSPAGLLAFTIVTAKSGTVTYLDNLQNERRVSWWDFVHNYRKTFYFHSEEMKLLRASTPAPKKPPHRKFKPNLPTDKVKQLLDKIAKVRMLADRPGTIGEGNAANAMISRLEAQLYI